MSSSPLKKNFPIFIHILGWALVGSFIFLLRPISMEWGLPILWWNKQALTFFLLVAAFYLNFFVLVPRLLFTNRTSLFLITNLACGTAYILLLVAYDEYFNMSEVMHQVMRPNTPHIHKPRNWYWDISNLFVFSMSVGISTAIATVQKWQADEKIRLELEQQQINSELSYLKAQINPHFFFNTLNNIYSLTNIDAEKAKTALLKLSRMMRYVLYETEKNHTMLSKELDFIRDYIELMKLRLSSRVHLDIQISERVDEAEIAPMLLLPFIENCFKHGISSQQDSIIKVIIEKKAQELRLTTENHIFKSSENTPEGNASGIGLTNTKRRLDLLYQGKYTLDTDDLNAQNQYIVNLNIQLK